MHASSGQRLDGDSGRSGLSGRTASRPERTALQERGPDAALASILIGPHGGGAMPNWAVVRASRLLPLNRRRLANAAAGLGAGGVVICAIAIEGSVLVRLLTLLTLDLRVARAEKILRGAGAARVHCYAVTPSLDRPTIAYELGTPAAEYADRHLRPGTGSSRLRRVLARIAGVDPSIGAVVVAGLLS